MDQNRFYTDFWNLLSDFEDFHTYGRRISRYQEPSFSFSPGPVEQGEGKRLSEVSSGEKPSFSKEPGAFAPSGTPSFLSGSQKVDSRKPVAVMGSPEAPLWVITDPPGVEAEKQGLPFGPEEMEAFEKWMKAIDLNLPEDFYVQNLFRFRLPGNRPPFFGEMNRGGRELHELYRTYQPRLILALGPSCSTWLSGQRGASLEELRGALHFWQDVPVLASYSPSQVGGNSALKRPVWEDLKRVRDILNGK